MPRFSIVVPAYEAASTLSETLEGILAQTLSDWECVVVDDGSSDDTLLIASSYSARDARIRVIHQENQGTAGAYNNGVARAVGDYVVICSADDILLPGHLSTVSGFIDREPGYDIYSTNGYYWWPEGRRQLCEGPGRGEAVHSLELPDVIRRCFYSVGAAYRRPLFALIGGYRLGVYGEDYDFWLRAMASGARHRYLPEALSLHRMSRAQKSARLETAFQSDIRLVSDLRRDFVLSPADSNAVDEAIEEKQRLIAQLHRPSTVVRIGLAHLVVRVLGRRAAWRLKSIASRLTGRKSAA